MKSLADRPFHALFLIFLVSGALYVFNLTLPYNLFEYVDDAPISFPQIARRGVLPAYLFLVTFAALFGCYILAYAVCRRRPDARLAPFVLGLGVALAGTLLFIYPVGAGDVVDYVSHGEELAYFGLNPLVVPPDDVPGSVFAPYSAFRSVTPNYGPLWMWVSALVVAIAGRGSLLLNLVGFKLVAIAAYAAQGWLIYLFLRRRRPASALAGLCFFAWNPLVLYEFAANGHNDAMMMALALLGILFWDKGRPMLMVTALTLSLLVKVPTAPLLPLFLLSAARQRDTARSFWTTGIVGAGLAVILIALVYLSLPAPLEALTNLSGRSDLFTHSLPTLVYLVLQMVGAKGEIAMGIARWSAILALGIWYGVQLIRVLLKPDQAHRAAYSVILFLLLFATPWFQPWYVTWLIALAALCPLASTLLPAGLLSMTVVISYVVYGFIWFWVPGFANWEHRLGINSLAVATTFLLPWIFTFVRFGKNLKLSCRMV